MTRSFPRLTRRFWAHVALAIASLLIVAPDPARAGVDELAGTDAHACDPASASTTASFSARVDALRAYDDARESTRHVASASRPLLAGEAATARIELMDDVIRTLAGG